MNNTTRTKDTISYFQYACQYIWKNISEEERQRVKKEWEAETLEGNQDELYR